MAHASITAASTIRVDSMRSSKHFRSNGWAVADGSVRDYAPLFGFVIVMA
jgi:hypothetical protein